MCAVNCDLMKHPKEQLFYRGLIYTITLVGLGDQTKWGYPPPKKIVIFNSFMVKTFAFPCIITQIVYLFVYRADLDFDLIGILFCILPFCVLANVNILSSKFVSYKKLMKNFMGQIHLYNQYYKHKNDSVAEKILVAERHTRYTACYLISLYSLNWVAWIWIPVLNNMKNVERIQNRTMKLQTCIYMWMPFDYMYNYRNWLVTHLVNLYVVFCGVTVLMMFHTVNYMFMYQLIGHIQVMKHKIRTEFTKDLSDSETREKLIEIIQYHNFILRVLRDLQSAFGFNIITNYLHNLVGDSLLMCQIMYGEKENMLMYMLCIFVIMGGLVIMSFVLEDLRREAEDLSDIVYAIPWEHMSVSNQKYLILILQRMQPTLAFRALGGFIAGVRPMISIIKTTFSYYVMLESTIAEK
ncbi:uncharacterized protein LOC121739702 [Aricia agestis]|uniref:uncharacterized protein LOC121739702 n=1 Tax=Aricia agestis TaxID=91739 RepID=UPI001C201CC9|nr:uncharacterized protein LOC121739702 [Aricia agestis]